MKRGRRGAEQPFDPERQAQRAAGRLRKGVRAAAASGGRFCLLCDGRRADLIAAWQQVIASVRSAALQCRLRVLTWQELAGCVPPGLQGFLREKYGIAGANKGSF